MREEPEEKPVAIGFGGPHYAPNFTEVVLKGRVAVGHILPNYAFDYIDETMFSQMIEKTIPKPELALVDWKGLKSEEKVKVKELCEATGIEYRKTKDFKH